MDKKTLEKMSEVEDFLSHKVDEWEACDLHFDPVNVEAMYAYASALIKWERDNFNKNSFFSTDNVLLIKYSKELQGNFKLLILNKDEGKEYEKLLKKSMVVYSKNVSNDYLN